MESTFISYKELATLLRNNCIKVYFFTLHKTVLTFRQLKKKNKNRGLCCKVRCTYRYNIPIGLTVY